MVDHGKLANNDKNVCSITCIKVRDKFISVKQLHSDIEIVYVETGWVDICVDSNEIVHVENNNLLLISSNVVHYFGDKAPGSNLYVIRMLPIAVIGQQFSESSKDAVTRLLNQSFMVHLDDKLLSILSEIINSNYNEMQECFLTAKLMEMTFYLLMNTDYIYNRILPTPYDNSEHLNRMLKFIEQKYSEKLTLKMLSDHLGLSKCYCSKYIKKKANMNFIECLYVVRINHAEEFLQETDLNITEIAYRVGFTSTQNFILQQI